MLHISDAHNCAIYYKREFVDKYYKVTTMTNMIFLLKAEGKQFPHLIGIKKTNYQRNRMTANDVYQEMLLSTPTLPPDVIRNNINESSKKGKKIKNFLNFEESFFENMNTICVFYNESLSTTKLSHVDYLFSNYLEGYSSGWIYDVMDGCCRPVTWIDESNGTQTDKEKYYQYQVVDLIDKVEIFDTYSNELLDTFKCKRTIKEYLDLFDILTRNHMTLKIKKNMYLIRLLKLIKVIKFYISF